MSFGDVLLLRKLGHGVLTFTGIVTALLGGWILLSAYTSVPDVATGDLVATHVVRKPSSVIVSEPYALAVDQSDSKVETVSLGCLRDGAHIKMKSLAKQIRLKSQLCGGRTAALDASSIINRANGFVATLYNLEGGGFTSDYISLENGTNQLMFEIDDGAGSRAVAEILISRGL